jgi:hypothetical protein
MKGMVTVYLKNKAEREAFLQNYENWVDLEKGSIGSRMTYMEVDLRFFRYSFRNGAKVIVTECNRIMYDGKLGKQVRYNLILPKKDSFNPFGQHSGHHANEFLTYNLHGISVGTIVDYMTQKRGEI